MGFTGDMGFIAENRCFLFLNSCRRVRFTGEISKLYIYTMELGPLLLEMYIG